MRARFAYTTAVLVMATAACGPDSSDSPAAGGSGGDTTGDSTASSTSDTSGSAGASGSGTTNGSTSAGGSGTTSGSAGAGGSATTGGGSGGDAGGSQGGTNNTGTTGEVGDPYGIVQFGSIFHYPNPGMTYQVAQAYFGLRQSGTSADACEHTAMGSCSVTDCQEPAEPPEQEPTELDPTPAPDAGAIQLRSTGDFTADLTAEGNGVYITSTASGTLLGGETVTITAAGGAVPAFTHTMEYPLVMLLTAPAFDDTQTELVVSHSEDLELTWERGFEGLTLQVQSQSTGPLLVCSFPSEAGAGTIQSELLSLLDPGTGLLLLGVESDVVNAGDVEVTISSTGAVMTPDRTRRAALVIE